MNNLFQKVDIILNSGQKSDFKIECDALTEEDIECFAHLIQKKYKFRKVVGVPRGGVRIEDALQKYTTNDPNDPLLMVDDVLTTGGSMIRYRKQYEEMGYDNIVGVVLFSRGQCPDWIESIFKMW
jgi:orotate phosphoribosyltransferase